MALRRIGRTLFFLVSLLVFPFPLLAEWTLETKGGTFVGELQHNSHSRVVGVQAQVLAGYQLVDWTAGMDFRMRYFESEIGGTRANLTNIPIGLTLRHQTSHQARFFVTWNWDDVLYHDFRIQFLDGFKIPKDYETAYEGPGSFVWGATIDSGRDWSFELAYSSQKFVSFKRRRPSITTGDLNQPIQLWTLSATLILKI